ncbi:homeobox-leucine zipper protein HDG1-like [Impatiens glandulifera]|uniref:homeobox-leucine zipper protein HDG1-like n=1 Tax=Impatiens glandulifera TaxID=253017 RepID=UPI001FB125D7|nr:homeobox-leucine zipper protein HDG1-like [Impatiens glandulifera]
MEESRLRLQIQLLRDELNKMTILAQRCLGGQITPLDLSNSTPIGQGEGGGVMESLNLREYVKLFAPCLEIKPDNNSTHYATRATGIIAANSSTILRALMDENQWPYLFQTIIGTSALIDLIQEDNGTNLKMMYAELQVLSSLIPVRKVKFIRFSRQGVWGMVDVSVENSHDISETNPIINCRRFPSGCIVQDMPNGGSKVTWVEHLDFEENEFNHPLGVMSCSSSFGAQRWLGSLKRQCLCLAIITSPHDRISGMVNQSRKRSMANMAHRMVVQVGETMVTIRNNNPGEPTGVVLSASNSFCMPISHQSLFNFLSHKHTRGGELMEVHSTIPIMRELVRIDKNNGDHLNRVSFLVTKVLHGNNQNSVPILQETQSDGSGSLLVYAQVTLEGMQTVMEGRDSSLVEIFPPGFSIIPNTKVSENDDDSCMSMMTVAFQLLTENSPGNMNIPRQTIEYINNLMSSRIQRIKSAIYRG